MYARLSAIFLFTGLIAVTGTACRKRAGTTATQDTVAAPSGEVTVSEAQLGRRLGSDKRMSARATTFSPEDTIYVSVLTRGSAPSATITARWTYGDQQVVKEESRTIAPNGVEAAEFHISKPSGWPVGKYKVTVSSGSSKETVDFQVK
jgi:hypothetical protein